MREATGFCSFFNSAPAYSDFLKVVFVSLMQLLQNTQFTKPDVHNLFLFIGWCLRI